MKKLLITTLLLLLVFSFLPSADAAAQGAVVRAVFFYSPACPYCHEVINETLLLMEEQYGEQLEVVAINVDVAEGGALYRAYLTRYNPSSQGWPALIVEDKVMVGVIEIPGLFPGIVEAGLASGGIDWPDFPEFLEAMEGQDWKSNPAGSALLRVNKALTVAGQDTFLARLTMFIMLLGLGVAFVKVAVGEHALFDRAREKKSELEGWWIPGLILVGLGISAYLTYTHYTNTSVVCGPFGGCEIVQNSKYSVVAGIPVASLGLAGYLIAAALWFANRNQDGPAANNALLLLFAASVVGTLFSIYLTYLEIAVIKAECIWCLASALIFSLILALISFQVPLIASGRQRRSRRSSNRRR